MRFDSTGGDAVVACSQPISTCRPIKSFISGPAPLYGTWVTLVWIADMNSMAQSCDDDPTPEVANVTFSPPFLASAMNSAKLLAGRSDFPTKTIGASVTRPIGAKPFRVAYGSLR
jgi:hypothetical protein